jgi:hypothetical protein
VNSGDLRGKRSSWFGWSDRLSSNDKSAGLAVLRMLVRISSRRVLGDGTGLR